MKNFVPTKYLVAGAPVFDLGDLDNEAGTQLFNEVVGTLSAAFANYTNDPSKGNRISKIQADQIGFAQAMSSAVEDAYQWRSTRGIEIVKTAILAIEYDEDTKALLSDVKKADALSGARGNSFMQQSVARGMEAAGNNGGGTGMAFMGMGMNAAGNMMGSVNNDGSSVTNPFINVNQNPAPVAPEAVAPEAVASEPVVQSSDEVTAQPAQPANDPYAELTKLKGLLDNGIITEEDFNAKKKQLLGL